MTCSFSPISRFDFLFALLAVASAGCDRSLADARRFVPAPANARSALEAALEAWQAGEPPGEVASSSPAVQVVDSHRRAGQELDSFEILGEVPSNAPRCFAVRLKLANPAEVRQARFVVLGVDPLWVLHEDDYEMMAHWEHPMPDEAAAEKKQQKE